METIDTVRAYQVEPGDLVSIDDDVIEVESALDDGSVIILKGFSHVAGDTVEFEISADNMIDLMGA